MSSFKFKKYKEQDKNIDYHLHSTFTDGSSSLREMVQRSIERNYNSIAFTDHVRSDSDYLKQYFEEIDNLNKEFNIKIYKGIEARISDFNGSLSYPRDIVPDIIVASVHRFSINDKLFKISDLKKEIAFELEKYLILQAIKKGECNVVGHCGGMCINAFNEFPISYFEEIIKACVQNNIAFEVNSRYHKTYIKELIFLLEKYNPLISYGSDAHNINEIRGIYD